MERCARRFSRSLQTLLVLALASSVMTGCAVSERGPDAQSFVHQIRQVLGDAEHMDVTVSQLVGQRWQQLCMHREGSLTVSLLELDNRHVLRVPYGQLSVVDGSSVDSLDGKCLKRDEMVHLRRSGNGADAAIVLERSRGELPVDTALAQE